MSSQSVNRTNTAFRKNEPTQDKSKLVADTQLSRFMEVMKTLQFAWFAGHVIVLTTTFLYVFSPRGSSQFHQVLYTLLYLGVIQSFGIIFYQQHYSGVARPQSTSSGVFGYLEDENIIYCFLALMWLFTPRFIWTIPHFFIFSLFHALTYVKSVLCPVVFQMSESSGPVKFLTKFLRENHEKSLSWSCNSELFCLCAVTLRALTFRRRLWVVLALYLLFIKTRYERSANMRSVVRKWEARIDGLISHPNIPSTVKQAYASSKIQIAKLGNYSLTNSNAAGSPAATASKKN